MIKMLHGTIHGRTITLSEDPGMSAGQKVKIEITAMPESSCKPGEGFLRTEGALAGDEEWDAIMEEIHRARGLERHPPIPDLGSL